MYEEYLVPALITFVLALISIVITLVVLLFNNIKRLEDKIIKVNEDISYLKGLVEGGRYAINSGRKKEV